MRRSASTAREPGMLVNALLLIGSIRRLRGRSAHCAVARAHAAKQTGSGTSHSAISETTKPTHHVSAPISGVNTGHGKTVSSAAAADTKPSISSDHRIAVTSRRLKGEGDMQRSDNPKEYSSRPNVCPPSGRTER